MSALPTELQQPAEYAARPRVRRFHVYNVGLAKTGTRSVAGIFSNYRSLHELLFPDTVKAVRDRENGTMSEADFRQFIRWRDGLTRLDVDSSSYNCHYVDVLAQEFEDAKFIFPMRDCFSWLDSLLNMVLFLSPMMVDWMVEYIQRFLGAGFSRELAARPDELHRQLPGMIDAGFSYWSATNRFVLDNVPGDRSLILRTSELSRSLPQLAVFVGVPCETLVPDLSLLNPAQRKHQLLYAVSRTVLEDAYGRHCSDLMSEFFPEIQVTRFLQGDQHVLESHVQGKPDEFAS